MAAFDTGFALAFTLAVPWCIGAVLWRTALYARTPQTRNIALMPAPRSQAGVVGRLCLEVLAFRSLWRASRITWVLAIAMHYGLLLVVLVHLRFAMEPLPVWMVPGLLFSGWAALACLTGLIGLLLRRIGVDRLRYISAPSDYLWLVLLLGIVLSGSAMKRVWPVDLVAVGRFARGLWVFEWYSLPASALLYLHLILVLLLLVLFPLSKLMHAPGIFFSPSLNQRDARAGDS